MRRKRNSEIVMTALICSGLIALVLWVYYSAVFGEKTPEKKEISVVLYDAGNNGWESLMEGMKQAEDDFSVRINFVTAKEGMTGEEQLELVRQEIADGAQGVLWAAADSVIITPEVQVPVIAVESNTDAAAYAFVSADNAAMGRMLGREILADFSQKKNVRIAVIEVYTERSSVRERVAGFYEVAGDFAELVVLQPDDKLEMALFLEMALSSLEVDAIAAFSKETLQALCEIKPEILEGKKIYGIGNAPSIVAALDKGKIEKLVFQNEFNIGYLSVEALLKEMDGIQNEIEEIDFYCVGKDVIHETQYERLLFPIVE